MLRQIRKKAKSNETLILLMYLKTLHPWTHVHCPHQDVQALYPTEHGCHDQLIKV
jgi:hypothetical protein